MSLVALLPNLWEAPPRKGGASTTVNQRPSHVRTRSSQNRAVAKRLRNTWRPILFILKHLLDSGWKMVCSQGAHGDEGLFQGALRYKGRKVKVSRLVRLRAKDLQVALSSSAFAP